ncbi:hypothetical protein B0J13DRAFT_513402 [Dactylonectria estremocensis]|uniref:Rhodopsin domain-containing protein n=1 Tax=Dactylonectria estremocensis TaxID=1079267 RepID=A0A9P9IGQ5_9HYPO|nr:hypothetical protein B0J13DRAFT_513402 [Dactylonectria estremocensis]
MHIRRADASPGDGTVVNHSLDGESRSAEICIILSIFCLLSTIAVVLRSYIRLVLLRAFGFDDRIMVVAQLLTIGTAVAIGVETKYGLGFHTWLQPQEQFIPYMQAFYSSVVIYNIAMCAVKIAILLQYRRIFAVRIMQFITFYGVVFMTAWTITLCFLLTLTCIPVAKFWDSTISGRCLNSLIIWYVMAGFNLATDVAIFCLPLPMIRSLQLPRKQKIMLFVIFCLGFFTCIISIIRIQTLKIAASTEDPNWDNVDAAIWSFLELNIAIIATCLPTLRPIFSKMMPRLFGSSLGRSQRRSGYGAYVQAPNNRSLANSNKKSTLGGSESTGSLQEHESIDASTHDFNTTSPPGDYHMSVSITGGETQHQFPKEAELRHFRKEDEVARGGIQARTVIIQQVANEAEKQEK